MNARIRQFLFIIFIIAWIIVAIITMFPYLLVEKYLLKPHLKFNKKTKEDMK